MLNPKTHFEQVPLETVRKMMEDQVQQKTAVTDAEATQKAILEEELLGSQEQPRAIFHAISHLEL
jgi:hypothetical protein